MSGLFFCADAADAVFCAGVLAEMSKESPVSAAKRRKQEIPLVRRPSDSQWLVTSKRRLIL